MSVRDRVSLLPAAPGVYRFRAADGRALYIGRAVDLRRRVASYWGDLRDRPHLRRMVPRVDRIEALVCDSEHEAAWLERNLLRRSMARWNRTAGGQEVPVHIRLDPRSGRLDVVHEHETAVARPGPASAAPSEPDLPGPRLSGPRLSGPNQSESHPPGLNGSGLNGSGLNGSGLNGSALNPPALNGSGVNQSGPYLFGPYLGGARVRLAVGGLHRVIPLAYTGDRLGGFDRDLARVRGVVATRESTVDELVRVLGRDAAAAARVRADLATRRDAAAAALAFELAARVQAELEALDWVLAEQNVTRPGDDDAEVHGWSSGLLVSFEIRAGQLVTWRQRPCAESEATARLGRTPVSWRVFADRNAALAAALVAPTGG